MRFYRSLKNWKFLKILKIEFTLGSISQKLEQKPWIFHITFPMEWGRFAVKIKTLLNKKKKLQVIKKDKLYQNSMLNIFVTCGYKKGNFSECVSLLLKIVHANNRINTFFSFENIKFLCLYGGSILKFFPIFLRHHGNPSNWVPQANVFGWKVFLMKLEKFLFSKVSFFQVPNFRKTFRNPEQNKCIQNQIHQLKAK